MGTSPNISNASKASLVPLGVAGVSTVNVGVSVFAGVAVEFDRADPVVIFFWLASWCTGLGRCVGLVTNFDLYLSATMHCFDGLHLSPHHTSFSEERGAHQQTPQGTVYNLSLCKLYWMFITPLVFLLVFLLVVQIHRTLKVKNHLSLYVPLGFLSCGCQLLLTHFFYSHTGLEGYCSIVS